MHFRHDTHTHESDYTPVCFDVCALRPFNFSNWIDSNRNTTPLENIIIDLTSLYSHSVGCFFFFHCSVRWKTIALRTPVYRQSLHISTNKIDSKAKRHIQMKYRNKFETTHRQKRKKKKSNRITRRGKIYRLTSKWIIELCVRAATGQSSGWWLHGCCGRCVCLCVCVCGCLCLRARTFQIGKPTTNSFTHMMCRLLMNVDHNTPEFMHTFAATQKI